MQYALKRIGELVSEQNIRKNIDLSIKEFHNSAPERELALQENKEENKLKLQLPNFFTPKNKQIIEILGTLHVMKKKNINDLTLSLKNKIDNDHHNCLSKMAGIKDTFIKDISNKIKLEKLKIQY